MHMPTMGTYRANIDFYSYSNRDWESGLHGLSYLKFSNSLESKILTAVRLSICMTNMQIY